MILGTYSNSSCFRELEIRDFVELNLRESYILVVGTFICLGFLMHTGDTFKYNFYDYKSTDKDDSSVDLWLRIVSGCSA